MYGSINYLNINVLFSLSLFYYFAQVNWSCAKVTTSSQDGRDDEETLETRLVRSLEFSSGLEVKELVTKDSKSFCRTRGQGHSRPQNLRSFWPAAGIENSGSNHFEITKEITELFCPSGLTQSAYMAHAWNGCSQSSRILPQARRIVGSGDENVMIRDLKPTLNENVGSEKLYLYY